MLAFTVSQMHQPNKQLNGLKTVNIFFAQKFKTTCHYLELKKGEGEPYLPFS
jgi:hypothetical protein